MHWWRQIAMQNIIERTETGTKILRGFVGPIPSALIRADFAELELRAVAAAARQRRRRSR
jgi:DNA polymerase I-like protein with 3'-5' exonuclease and polymerase domains